MERLGFSLLTGSGGGFLMKENKKTILKVLVGSWAHGLADKDSDRDYRAVYVLPTSDILSLGYRYKGTDWIEGVEDNTAYEIGHLLHLATKCNPTILEVFKAPVIENSEDGEELRKLFPYIWNPQGVFDAFVGYGLNQRKKFLDKKDNRQNKYAVAYLRTLNCLIDLLSTRDFSVEIKESHFKLDLLRIRKGKYEMGEIINKAEALTAIAKSFLEKCKNKQDLTKVNKFLVKIRKKYW